MSTLVKELRETAGDAGNGLDRESRAAIDKAADLLEAPDVRKKLSLSDRLRAHAEYLDFEGCEGSFSRDLSEAARLLDAVGGAPK